MVTLHLAATMLLYIFFTMKNKAIYLASTVGNSVRTEMAAHTGGDILPCVPRKGRPPLLRISKLPPIIQKYVIYKYVAYNIYLFSKHPLELKQPTKTSLI